MEKKRIIEVLIVLAVLAVGFLIVSQQRQTNEEPPAVQLPEQESRVEILLKSLGINPDSQELTETEKEKILAHLDENSNSRELTEEEIKEHLELLDRKGLETRADGN